MLPIARNLGGVASPEQPTFGDEEIRAPPPVSVLLRVGASAAQAQRVLDQVDEFEDVVHEFDGTVKRARRDGSAFSRGKAKAAKPSYEELERKHADLTYMYGVLLEKHVVAVEASVASQKDLERLKDFVGSFRSSAPPVICLGKLEHEFLAEKHAVEAANKAATEA
jgi:hypothetical protein